MVNSKKCEVMFIGTHQRLNIKHNRLENCHVIISGNEIKKVDPCKYLGVVIDRNLSWNSQIEHVKKKKIIFLKDYALLSISAQPYCSIDQLFNVTLIIAALFGQIAPNHFLISYKYCKTGHFVLL